MNRTIVFEILVVIEVPEPFLLDPYLWKTDELLMLCAGHLVTPNLLDFQPQVLWSREAQAFQPHSCGLAAAELASSRAGVSLFSHTIVALGLSTALSTSLQWLRYGKVLRSYSVIKVQVRDRCWGRFSGKM